MLDASVRVEGLKELRRGLKAIDPALPKALRDEMVKIGGKVADDARVNVPVKSGRAARSIKAGASGNRAYIQGGKKTVAYYGWLDFGSRRPISGRARSVGPWAGSGAGPKAGRFIYPAIKKNRDAIRKAAAEAFESVAAKSLPK